MSRIALVLERVVPARGGSEAYAAALAMRLAGRGHQVTLVAAEVAPAAATGVAVAPIPVPRGPKAWRVWAFAQRAAAATAGRFDVVHGLQKSLGHDVFHPHTGSHAASLAAARATRRTPVRRAFHALSKALSLKQWVFAAIERRQYAQRPPPRFVAISESVAEEMRTGHGVPADRIVVLPNPVDLDRFHPGLRTDRAATRAALGEPPDTPIALFLAHEYRLKGLEPLLRALALAPGPLRLWVAGREPAGPWQRLAARLGVTGRIRWLGPAADPAPLYGAADALVLPAFRDPAPLTVLEALACGLPTLVSAASGHAPQAREAGGEVVADPWDAAALAAALARVVVPAGASTRARAVAARHSWDAHLAALEAIYAAAVSGRADA